MGFFDSLDNDTENMHAINDKDIALGALIASKSDISLLSKVVPETVNPQLRQMLTAQLNSCINEHFTLSDMAISKGWYAAYSTPHEQLEKDLNKVEDIKNQL